VPDTPPTLLRLQLGKELRKRREQAGFSRQDAARRLRCSPSKITRMEIGTGPPTLAETEVLLRYYGVPEGPTTDEILDIAERARQRDPLEVPDWLRAFVGREAEATAIRMFEIELVPGLLQTEPYIRAIATAANPGGDPGEVERLVEIRSERQKRLFGNEPPRLWAVIHEAAIRCMVGGPDVMRGQVRRLLELADVPQISIQILPFSVGAHPAMSSPFIILDLPDPPDSRMVYLETLWRSDYVNRARQVDAYSDVFDRLCAFALDEQGTVAMLERVVGDLR
jgi:transcriptional regulator with XRE-family HTH domain